MAGKKQEFLSSNCVIPWYFLLQYIWVIFDMDLKDLTNYAKEKYGIEEEFKWNDFPGFSVLSDPVSKKWVALLMRQYDEETGDIIERCDLKCGRQTLGEYHVPYLTMSYRMKGDKWIGIKFVHSTNPNLIYKLFDRAVSSGEQRGYTIVLDNLKSNSQKVFQSTPLNFSSMKRKQTVFIPDMIRKMQKIYEYKDNSFAQKAKNFYWQGKYMEPYEDDFVFEDDVRIYFPTYHDLSIPQLRGYFAFRTRIRKGEYPDTNASFGYMYLYELINDIGVSSKEDALEKMKAFREHYIETNKFDKIISQHLDRWMTDYVVKNRIDTPIHYLNEDLFNFDLSLLKLKYPEIYDDKQITDALLSLEDKTLKRSLVLKSEKGQHLFAELWKLLSRKYSDNSSRGIFEACFNKQKMYRVYPFGGAVYYKKDKPEEYTYELTPLRKYICHKESWEEYRYDKIYFNQHLFSGLLHEAERSFRIYLKLGHPLKEMADEAWVKPYLDEVIQSDIREEEEARRPKVEIDFSRLDTIRKDAKITEESLMTEEEQREDEIVEQPVVTEEKQPAIDIDPLYLSIMEHLLEDQPITDILKDNHLMPSLVTDILNELFYDEIGDNVLEFDGSRITVVEDYRDDILHLLEGDHNE